MPTCIEIDLEAGARLLMEKESLTPEERAQYDILAGEGQQLQQTLAEDFDAQIPFLEAKAQEAGYSSIDKLVLDVGITERNFRGRGQNLRARASVGSLRQQIDFGFSEPRFLGRNLVAGLNLYTFRYDLSQFAAYDTKSVGGDIRFGASPLLRMALTARQLDLVESSAGSWQIRVLRGAAGGKP